MNELLRQQYEQSLYKELYHLEGDGKTLVIHELTQKLYVRKMRKHYDPEVYRWLMAHPDPHIPKIHAVVEEQGVLTVLEDYVQGETLAELLERGALPEEEKRRILIEICDGLITLHHAQPPIIHRDIKAENIMIESGGMVKIMDYDAAKQYHPGKTRDTVLIGTEGSAAPEQYGFRQSDERTDVYALGVLIKRMFPEDAGMLLVADRATELDPVKRYQSVQDLRKKLVRYQPVWLIPPGFRTLRPWKMLLAAAGYFLLFYCCFNLKIENSRGAADLFLNRVAFFLFGYLLIVFYANLESVRKLLPFRYFRSRAVRVVGYLLGSLIFALVPVLILIVLENLIYG